MSNSIQPWPTHEAANVAGWTLESIPIACMRIVFSSTGGLSATEAWEELDSLDVQLCWLDDSKEAHFEQIALQKPDTHEPECKEKVIDIKIIHYMSLKTHHALQHQKQSLLRCDKKTTSDGKSCSTSTCTVGLIIKM